MEKITAKFNAFGRLYEGTVIKVARTRVLVRWDSSTGKVRETWFKPVEVLTNQQGVCVLSKPLATGVPKVVVEVNAQAIAARKAPPPVVYPPGSVRELRQRLMAEARELRLKLLDCISCANLRAEANRKVNEADRLLMQAIEETEQERGRSSRRAVKYDGPKETP